MQLNNQQQPLVSIIMGTYNGGKNISRCIDSIISQSYQNWEFIICDDCSTDNTIEIVQEYANHNSKIRLLRNTKNQGLAYSLNECLKNSNGTYIARMDDDDICLIDRLLIQVDYLEKHLEFQLVSSNVIVFDGEKEYGVRSYKEIPDLKCLINKNAFCHPAVMFRKSAFDILKGYNENCKRAQDYELWFRFFYNNFKGYNIQQPLLKYHESIQDYKKRTLSKAIKAFKIGWNGCNLNQIPFRKRLPLFKGIIASILPDYIMVIYHTKKLKRN